MKPTHILMLAGIILISPTVSHAQVAGTTVLGVSVAEMREVALGWSVKHTILGQHVYNDKNERVGTVDDLIVTPDKALSYAIVNVGGFLGLLGFRRLFCFLGGFSLGSFRLLGVLSLLEFGRLLGQLGVLQLGGAELKPIDAGHHQVEQDQAGVHGLSHLERFFAA